EKRGGNLAAPLPKNDVGQCGYLNEVTEAELRLALADYKKVCRNFPRQGRGIEPLCSDVGLENPGTVGCAVATA
ncbi:MAG: 3-dehydroquinate synthase, partial [Planctomycetota bacterium]